MAATAPSTVPVPEQEERPATRLVAVEGVPGATPVAVRHDDTQAVAEASLLRDCLIGMAVGAVVCAGLWVAFVAIALVGTDWALGPPLWMGAAVGVFSGLFFGGWAGTVIGAHHLEHAEHESLPPA